MTESLHPGTPIEVRPSRLAFIDMDDTLLGPDKTISPENLAALDRLREAGISPVIASGRHHFNIIAFPELHDVGWVLSSQGATVRHAGTGEILREVNIPADRVTALCDQARQRGLTLLAYRREGAYIERITPWSDLYAAKAGWKPEVRDFHSLPEEGFQKIFWSDEPQRITALFSELRAGMAASYQMVITEPELLEFLAPGATKASGAKVLAEHLGFDPQDTLAFGDGNNDVEILQWAGLSVAMAHGRESARRAAQFVSPPGPPESALARAVDLALTKSYSPEGCLAGSSSFEAFSTSVRNSAR